MTVAPTRDHGAVERFVELLLGMSYDDPAVRPLLELEGLKEWRPGRTQRVRAARGGGGPARLLRRDGRCSHRLRPVTQLSVDLDDSGSTGRRTCSSSWRCRAAAPASGGGARARPGARPPPRARGAERRATGSTRADGGARAVVTARSTTAWRGCGRAAGAGGPARRRPHRRRLGARRPRRAGRAGRARASTSPSVDRDVVWADARRSSTPRPRRRSGTRPPRSTGRRRSTSPPRSRTRSSR